MLNSSCLSAKHGHGSVIVNQSETICANVSHAETGGHRLAFAIRAAFQTFRNAFSGRTERHTTCGPAKNTERRPERGVMLLCKREILLADRREAVRKHKAVSSIDRQIAAITREILGGGHEA